MKLIILISVFLHEVISQPWANRFDYDYQPVPISPSHQQPPFLVQRRPMRMLAPSPRYRPDAMEHQHQFIEDPFYPHPQPPIQSRPPPQISQTAAGFGGSYFPEAPVPIMITPSQPAPTPQSNGVTDFMSRLATTLPEIAEKMSKLSPSSGTENNKFNSRFNTFSPETQNENSNNNNNKNSGINENDFLGNIKKSGLGMFFVTDPKTNENNNNNEKRSKNDVANVVDSMPGPNSLFSFNKLFSAFTPTTLAPVTVPVKVGVDQKDRTIYDMRQIKGTPILKDEDEHSEFIQKPDEFVSAAPPSTEAPNPAENLLGTILSGKIDQVDWIGAIFKNNSIPGAGEQNPITQILKGGIFGSGLDDDTKITKPEDQNFN
uniref:Uncharacterized protein n=1 Tax=Panagrolaimus sp. PS1159 TaxID=55785 RepID=A0AC35GPX2_9BILA